MAHTRVIAQRQAIAYQRLLTAVDRLGSSLGVSDKVKEFNSIAAKDPAVKQMLQSEALADLMESLADDKKSADKPADKKTADEEQAARRKRNP